MESGEHDQDGQGESIKDRCGQRVMAGICVVSRGTKHEAGCVGNNRGSVLQ